MNQLIGLLIILSLFGVTFYFNDSFSQGEITIFDTGAPISQLAYNLSDYHLRLAEEELAKVPPNKTGATVHSNLGGMTVAQIGDMIEGATLSEADRQKLLSAGPGNCIINSNGTVLCLN